ncbi:hypothetical protein glysoja_049393 [Glycine soja]|uniref:Uncharacterized protein n=1 Tax=Glycine soja TaxID=3848 RepID=A0A0B2QJS9_GLYSO|nr:hypothetical protein glysoja_049393 [Glycine soja]
MYNVWDLSGRYIPLLKCLELESRELITITTSAPKGYKVILTLD